MKIQRQKSDEYSIKIEMNDMEAFVLESFVSKVCEIINIIQKVEDHVKGYSDDSESKNIMEYFVSGIEDVRQ